MYILQSNLSEASARSRACVSKLDMICLCVCVIRLLVCCGNNKREQLCLNFSLFRPIGTFCSRYTNSSGLMYIHRAGYGIMYSAMYQVYSDVFLLLKELYTLSLQL